MPKLRLTRSRRVLLVLGGCVLLMGSVLAWQVRTQQQWREWRARAAVAEELYRRPDTVYRHADSVFVVSRKLDTVAVATGIFSYLKYYYPDEMSRFLLEHCQAAVALQQQDWPWAAQWHYRAMTAYHRLYCSPYHGFSDLNNLLTVGTQDAILCAYAHQQLGQLDEALAVLRPWLAHSETSGTKVKHYYLELCRQRYGRQRVQQELAAAPASLHPTRLHDPTISPEYEAWVIDVFGAEMGLDYGLERPSVAEVTAALHRAAF